MTSKPEKSIRHRSRWIEQSGENLKFVSRKVRKERKGILESKSFFLNQKKTPPGFLLASFANFARDVLCSPVFPDLDKYAYDFTTSTGQGA